jgi:hypothetical protein
MKTGSLVVLGAAVLVGLGGAGIAYDLATLEPATEPAVSSTTNSTATAPRVRWKPCEPPAVLEGRSCVTALVQVVPLSQSIESSNVPAAPGAAEAAPARQPNDSGREDDGKRSGHDDLDDDSRYDDDDDHHEDDHDDDHEDDHDDDHDDDRDDDRDDD